MMPILHANFGIRHAAGFSSEADVENFFTDQKRSEFALGAVVFDKESFDGDNVRSGTTITYKIRLRAEEYAGTYESGAGSGDTVAPSSRWQTSHMFPRTPSVGPQGDLYGGQTPGWYESINSNFTARRYTERGYTTVCRLSVRL